MSWYPICNTSILIFISHVFDTLKFSNSDIVSSGSAPSFCSSINCSSFRFNFEFNEIDTWQQTKPKTYNSIAHNQALKKEETFECWLNREGILFENGKNNLMNLQHFHFSGMTCSSRLTLGHFQESRGEKFIKTSSLSEDMNEINLIKKKYFIHREK